MGLRLFLFWSSLLVIFADCGVLYRRQVLPPIPGYIPVYIQHGDVPPEDPHHYAQIFQVADKIVPPRVFATMNFPAITTEITADNTTVPPADDSSATTADDATNRNDLHLNEESTTEIASYTVSDINDAYTQTTNEPGQ